jgi:predicted heme/steroid binding protein
MDFLSRYERELDDDGFNDALEEYLYDNYTSLDGEYWLDDDGQVFTCSDSVTFEGGEEGDGFKSYKSLVDDPDELLEVIGALSSELSRVRAVVTKLNRDR